MKSFLKYFSLAAIASILVCFVACEPKDNGNDNNNNNNPITREKAIAALTEFAQTSNQFSATVKESGNRVDASGLTETKNLYGTKDGEYPVVSCQAQGTGMWLVTCNYGETPVTCSDGYQRRGIVRILTDGLFTTQGTTMTITFDNFYQKGDWLAQEYKIEGTQVITNLGANENNQSMTNYSVEVQNGLITYNTKEINYTENTIRTLEPSATLCENNWYITGTWNGVSSDDVPYTLTANSTPLHYKVCCHFFQDGILNVDVEGLSPFTINYGLFEGEDADCGRKAQINYSGIIIPIDM